MQALMMLLLDLGVPTCTTVPGSMPALSARVATVVGVSFIVLPKILSDH